MGREIRRVPPNWQHPKKMFASGMDYVSMHDQTFEQACATWDEGKRKWDAGEDPDRKQYDHENDPYEDWAGERPDDPEYYRPWKDEEATWFQLWQTVSEGSPVSPPFATLEELAQHLAKHGDDWDQQRGNAPWGIERARRFCKSGWAPSFVAIGGALYDGTNIPALPKDDT